MSESATSGLRERRMAETRAQLTLAARRLTTAHGLSGFTIEELCEQVGVSRRTFFNYFHSKEDAIIGHSDDTLQPNVVEAFLAGGDREGEIGPRLLDDLAGLAIAEINRIGISPDEAAEFIAAVDKEPQLLRRLLQSGAERERFLTALIEEREGLPAGDRRAEAAVLIFTALVRSSCERFFIPGNTAPFDSLLYEALGAARAVFLSAR